MTITRRSIPAPKPGRRGLQDDGELVLLANTDVVT